MTVSYSKALTSFGLQISAIFMMKLRLIIYLLYLKQFINADSSKGLMTDQQFLVDLKMLCPYNSSCKEKASLPFTKSEMPSFRGSEEKMPCCQMCSCNPSCGLDNNCCFKHLDLYDTDDTYQMICESFKLKSNEVSQHFRMISQCFSNHAPFIDVQNKSDEHFQPVYSTVTGYIYFNVEIASCNNATGIVPFQRAITCSFQDDYMSDADRILQGLKPVSECNIQYQPPAGVDLESEKCNPHLIRTCNVTGVMKEREPFLNICESFNATFVFQTPFQEYLFGNIYCFMCNKQPFMNQSKSDMCSPSEAKTGGEKVPSLTVILTPGLKYEDENQHTITKTASSCPDNSVAVHSLRKACRPIKCPIWKMLVRGRCIFYSKQWIGSRFAIILQLEPAPNNNKISKLFFENMSKYNRNDRVAKWLKRKTMKRWKMDVFYHPSVDEVSIEYLVIEAKCPFFSVNPRYIEETVKAALDDSWSIVDDNKTITLNMYWTEGRSYVSYMIDFGKGNDTQNTYPYALFREGDENFNDEPLYYVLDGVYQLYSEKILLTKLFFCHQVDLLPDEFEDNLDSIFFKVKNITLYDFRRVNSIASEDVKHTVRVCLSEFESSPSTGISNHLFEANMNVPLTSFFLMIEYISMSYVK